MPMTELHATSFSPKLEDLFNYSHVTYSSYLQLFQLGVYLPFGFVLMCIRFFLFVVLSAILFIFPFPKLSGGGKFHFFIPRFLVCCVFRKCSVFVVIVFQVRFTLPLFGVG